MSKLTVRRPKPSERRFLDEKLADRALIAYVLDRYRIVDAILRGDNPSEVARYLGCERPKVYKWVYSFNMHNLPLHTSNVLLEFFQKNRRVPVWTLTYSSWLNLIECQLTLNVSDDPDHQTRRRRLYRYMRWRNPRVGSQYYKLAKVFKHQLGIALGLGARCQLTFRVPTIGQ